MSVMPERYADTHTEQALIAKLVQVVTVREASTAVDIVTFSTLRVWHTEERPARILHAVSLAVHSDVVTLRMPHQFTDQYLEEREEFDVASLATRGIVVLPVAATPPVGTCTAPSNRAFDEFVITRYRNEPRVHLCSSGTPLCRRKKRLELAAVRHVHGRGLIEDLKDLSLRVEAMCSRCAQSASLSKHDLEVLVGSTTSPALL